MKLTPIPLPSTKKLEPHPHSKIMPQQTEEEFKNLLQDIGKNGVLSPIVLYQGKILDGVHRWNALVGFEFKKPASFVEFDGTDAEAQAFVISANIHRRHLSPDQRRQIIDMLLKADPTKSNRQIADTAKADHKTVGVVREGMEERGEIPHVETRTDSTGRNQPATKSKKKKSGEKEKITYQKVVNAKTALNAYSVLEEHLLDALQDVKEYSDFSQADDYGRKTIEKLEAKLGEMQPEMADAAE